MYRVLLVDDEDLIRESIRKRVLWGKLGYELVGSCRNGKEAILLVREQEVDVVITDICMPYVDGMELSCFLHEEYPDVKIIIISGYDEFGYAKKAMKYKVVEYLLKPFTASELSEVLYRLKIEMDETFLRQETIKKQLLLIRGQVLYDLLLWNKEEAEHRKDLEALQIHLQESNMKVAIIDFALENEEEAKPKSRSTITSFAVYKIAEELVRHFEPGIVFQGRDNRIYILFHSHNPKKYADKAESICREIKDQACNCLKLDLSIGLGSFVHELSALKKSYAGAEKALLYRYLFGSCFVLDIDKAAVNDQFSINQFVDELMVEIKGNHHSRIMELFLCLSEELRNGFFDYNRIMLYLQQCILSIHNMLVTAELLEEKEFIEQEEILLQEIGDQIYLGDAIRLVTAYCIQAAAAMEEAKAGSGTKISIQAKSYIMDHFANPDLSLHMVCSKLAISPSYFSSIYKANTGETFLETLNRVRMTKAKELLAHTSLKNYEVAERVGYRDPHYFSIAFKKSTGLTPKEYAKESR